MSVTARPDYALNYVHSSEGGRLDFERRYFPVDNVDPVGSLRREWWQHAQSYQPWSTEEARHHHATALQCLTRHDHPITDHSQLTRENCGACVLGGYRPRGGWGDPETDAPNAGPNYAGWARIYVEAGHPIPLKWRKAFADQGSDNRAYYDALGRSLVTFGVRFAS